MTYTQQHIDELLDTLKILLDQIHPLRDEVKILEENITQVHHDYEQKLGTLDDDFTHLQARERYLRMSLSTQHHVQPSETPDGTEAHVPLPTNTNEDDGLLVPDPSQFPQPLEDPRLRRKRALADHIEYFIPDADREVVMQIINAILTDERRDMGDMLELLSWGEIWSVRAAWESIEEQYMRLENWHNQLESRLIYWQGTVQRLRNDPLYSLWEQWQTSSSEEWNHFLERLTQERAKKNDELAYEVSILEEQWQARQSGSEETDHV